MTAGICPLALQLPGPERKTGYNYHTTDLTHDKTGVTIHTAEYDTSQDEPTLHNALFSGREASWHFTITKEGWLFQHYPVNAVTWHCGYNGNLWTVGIECEGYAPNKISGPQYQLLVKLLRWIYSELDWKTEWHCQRLAVLAAPHYDAWLWEHKDWMNTLCQVFSRGMIDPDQLICDLKEEPMPDIDWPKEKLRLLSTFLEWWEWFPETQAEKDALEAELKQKGTNIEERMYRTFYDEQIAWRSPPR